MDELAETVNVLLPLLTPVPPSSGARGVEGFTFSALFVLMLAPG